MKNTSKLVWLVTTGNSDDYYVYGIFSSEENAEKYMETKGYDDMCLEEWTLDEALVQLDI